MCPGPYGGGDVTEKIMALLRSNNAELSSSTESFLRHIISTEVAVHEAKLRKAEETILELGNKLDNLQGTVTIASPNPLASPDAPGIQFGTMGNA